MPDAIMEASAEKGLLREWVTQAVTILESEDTGKPLRFKAKVQEADKVNQNGRVYPRTILEREVAKINTELTRRPGAVNHPDGFSANVRDIGVLWKSFEMNGGEVWGTGEIIPTSSGQDLEAIMRSGVEIGFSSRGWGTSKFGDWNGQEALIIQDDYQLYTVDAVSDPSVYDARVQTLESFNINELMEENPQAMEALTKAVQERLTMPEAAAAKEGLEVVVQPEQPNDGEPQTTVVVTQAAIEQEVAAGEGTPKEEESEGTPKEETDNHKAELETQVSELASKNEELTSTLEARDATIQETTDRLKTVEALFRETVADAESAISSIISIITSELSAGNFYSAQELTGICSTLKYYTLTAEEAKSADELLAMEVKKIDYTALIDTVRKLVTTVSTETLEDYATEKLKGENQYIAGLLADELKNCTSREEIDSKYESFMRVLGKAAAAQPEGRGLVLDPQEQRAPTVTEQYAIAGRLSSIKPTRRTI